MNIIFIYRSGVPELLGNVDVAHVHVAAGATPHDALERRELLAVDHTRHVAVRKAAGGGW